jgi:3-deoxy-D-manno-octulosonic-acid transferase
LRPVRQGVAALTALAGAPLGACAVALRPSWRVGLSERLGVLDSAGEAPLWMHAASAGEAAAASRVAAVFRDRGDELFLSTTTVAGRERLRAGFPGVPVALAPLDHPWCVDAALHRVHPSLLLLLETELWPVWIAAANRRDIPVVVISARLSDRSFPRYRRAQSMFAPTLGRLAAVGARSELDAQRFAALGVPSTRISVTGDLKLEPLTQPPVLAEDLRRMVAGCKLLVAGSTHDGEEVAALGATAACEAAGLPLNLVLAPRRLERVAAIERLVAEAGRSVRRRSASPATALEPGEVLVLDSMGELAAVYGEAQLAFVGGTLAPVGGHNLLEPLHAACPVVFGPQVENVPEAAEILCRSGAGVQVRDAEELARQAVSLFRDRSGARVRVAAGQAELERHRGSTQRSVELVDRVLRETSALRRAS